MASISSIYSSSPTLNFQNNQNAFPNSIRRRSRSHLPFYQTRPKFTETQTRSVAREVPTNLSAVQSTSHRLEKDPRALWRRYVDWLYQHKEIGLYLDVSRVGFTDEFVEEMEPRLLDALEAMEKLEKGAIANPDEGRMVGHYWLRDSSRAPNLFLKSQIDKTLDAICGFADDVVSGKIKPPASPEGRFTQILSVGIGGSALGPQFVAEALAPDNPPLKIRFIDNTDPAGIDHQIAQLGPELASTLVIVISKSGGTPETRNGLLEVQKAFREAGLDFPKQGVAITQENSLLDNTARIEGWLARFPMFDWVGGRTSEMSAVGLLPAALQTIDIREMLLGASLMDEANRNTVIKNNPAALLALCWYWATDGVGSKDMVILPYKDSLLLFSRYLQQLVMESLGKEYDLDGNRVNQGISVYGNKGSTDQHAYIQQLREGVHNFFATFIEVLRDRPPGHDWELEPGVTCGDYLFGMLQGTRSALYSNDRESITVTVQEVTPRSVGALVALYERAVGIYASLVNINAYHQPGVEAGKKAAGEVLALQKRVLAVLNEASCKEPVEPLTIEEVAEHCHAPEDVQHLPNCSVAREVPTNLSAVQSTSHRLEKDPRALWRRYVDWLYQHKEIGLYLDVSRVGFTDEFVEEMEPRLLDALEAMEKLEKGAIANPDEGRMVGHYWLRDSSRAPNLFLKSQIDKTLDAICGFADDVVSGKIKPPASPEGRFTQILSVGIGGFVAEAQVVVKFSFK